MNVRPTVLAVLLLALLTWAGVRALAAWYFLEAQTISTGMSDSGETTQAQLDEANARVLQALEYFPEHPDYLDLAGRLQELQADQPGVVGKAHREALENAAGYYRRALAVRPLWPYSWVNLLAVKDKLGQVDTEFNRALHRAAETGPWERGVQMQILSSGLRYWDRLAAPEKSVLHETVESALRVQPKDVFELVKRFGRPEMLCDKDVDYTRIRQWCSEVEPRMQD